MDSVTIDELTVQNLSARVGQDAATIAALSAQIAFLGQQLGQAQARVAELEAIVETYGAGDAEPDDEPADEPDEPAKPAGRSRR